MEQKQRLFTMKIVGCEECPNFIHDDDRLMERWGKSWCNKLDREVNCSEIPEDCPLPFV